VLERWQISPIINIFSGTPFSFTTTSSTFNQLGDNTPILVGPMPHNGKVTRVADGVIFFPELKQVIDPAVQSLTSAQSLNTRSTLYGIADASGRPLMVNPEPGVLGNVAPLYALGPVSTRFDINLLKRIQIAEGKELELRIDAIDVLNSPQFATIDGDINSTTFGRLTTATGSRVIVVGGRFSF
jgi:hypothetical protein